MIIQLDNVSFSYTNEPFLHELNMKIPDGDFVGIIGPNGGGKTTVLKLILGLITPQHGKIKVFGHKPNVGRKYISYISQHQEIDLDFPITVEELILQGRLKSIFYKYNENDYLLLDKYLNKLNITHLKNNTLRELSGGERQRVFLAKALISEPKLLMLDEPINNIDSKNQEEFYKLLKELNKEITIIVVDHNLEMISDYITSVVCVNKCSAESLELHKLKDKNILRHTH